MCWERERQGEKESMLYNNFFFFLVNTIVDVYTVEQLKIKALKNKGKTDPFYGILYAYISTLNIDDETTKVVRNRW